MTKTLLFWLNVADEDADEARPDGWQWLEDYVKVEHWGTGSTILEGELNMEEIIKEAMNWRYFCEWTLGECIEAINAMGKLVEVKNIVLKNPHTFVNDTKLNEVLGFEKWPDRIKEAQTPKERANK